MPIIIDYIKMSNNRLTNNRIYLGIRNIDNITNNTFYYGGVKLSVNENISASQF